MQSSARRSFDYPSTLPGSSYSDTIPGNIHFQATVPGKISPSNQSTPHTPQNPSVKEYTPYFSDTIHTLPHGHTPFQRRQTHQKNLDSKQMSELLKHLVTRPAANDPHFNPTPALSLLHKIKNKLLQTGNLHFACMIEQDEHNFLKDYTKGMQSLVPNPTTNVVNYRKAKIAQIKVQIHEGRTEQIQTAKLQLELRLRWLQALKDGKYPKLKTPALFQSWAREQAYLLAYKDFAPDELRFILNSLYTYSQKTLQNFWNNKKRSHIHILQDEMQLMERAILKIDTELRELRQTIGGLKRSEHIVHQRELITNDPNIPLDAFPLDRLEPNEQLLIQTDVIGECIIKKLSDPFSQNGEYFYQAVIQWNTPHKSTSSSKSVLIRAPLMGYLDIRDLQWIPLDFFIDSPLHRNLNPDVLPKILKKTKIATPQKNTPHQTSSGIFWKVKKFFWKLFH
jgi:hypothetical protein